MNTQRLATVDNAKFKIRGINHIALVCADMRRTVAFYEGILGMPLFKTSNIKGLGQHFFFDMGGCSLAFFWFQGRPEPSSRGWRCLRRSWLRPEPRTTSSRPSAP